MSIRVNTPLHNSFVLDEPELRRIIKVLTEQMAQVTTSNNFTITYRLELKNRMSLEKTSLEDVFTESNGGSHEIKELGINFRSTKSSERISLTFKKDFQSSISYDIYGDDRSWTTITQSIIEERIRNLKQPFIISGFSRFFSILFSIIILIIVFVVYTTVYFERLTNTTPKDGIFVSTKFAIVFLLAIIFLAIGFFSYIYFFSPQIFNWGDYTRVYQTRQSIGKSILIVVIIGLVIGVLGSIIASYILT